MHVHADMTTIYELVYSWRLVKGTCINSATCPALNTWPVLTVYRCWLRMGDSELPYSGPASHICIQIDRCPDFRSGPPAWKVQDRAVQRPKLQFLRNYTPHGSPWKKRTRAVPTGQLFQPHNGPTRTACSDRIAGDRRPCRAGSCSNWLILGAWNSKMHTAATHFSHFKYNSATCYQLLSSSADSSLSCSPHNSTINPQ